MEAYSQAEAQSPAATANVLTTQRLVDLRNSLSELRNKEWGSAKSRMTSGAESNKKAAYARAWLTAHFERGLLTTAVALLGFVKKQAAVAASVATPVQLRCELGCSQHHNTHRQKPIHATCIHG